MAKIRDREFAFIPVELAQVQTEGRTMTGYASAFNYPIDSSVGGSRQTTYVRPGAFTKTLKENRDAVKVLFNHGMDPRYGKLPIGVPTKLQEDKRGLYAEVDLHDGPDNQNIIAALAQGALNAMSIQFEVTDETFNEDRSERYINAVKLYEFGPVTFPANAGAVARLHSLPDMMAEMREQHWDGAAALRSASNAAEFRKIAFERANDSDADTAAHWALPHHPNPAGAPGNADPAGVAAALAALHGGRGGEPALVMSVDAVEAHLQRHQAESSSDDGRATEKSAGTPLSADRLTWLKKGQLIKQHERELEEMAARIKGL
jgi:HK97 family phage prohead protease